MGMGAPLVGLGITVPLTYGIGEVVGFHVGFLVGFLVDGLFVGNALGTV